MLHLDVLLGSTLSLLQSLQSHHLLSSFNLVGGTSLALQLGHRKSIDLDFFTQEEFDEVELFENLAQSHDIQVLNQKKNTLQAYINGVKVDFLRHAYPELQPPLQYEAIRLSSVTDISANKILAITNRGSKKDFVDLATLLRKESLGTLLSYFQKKYSRHEAWMALKSMTYFEDAELDPDPEMLIELDWASCKEIILAAVKNQY